MPLWDRIVELLSLPEHGAGSPSIEAIETTLTDGYTAALAIDAERWRIEQRLGNATDPKEIARLSKRLETAQGDLTELRSLLRSLHARARALRRAA
jgi:predicted  nucleic acid-binding Zn-ribbon protein